MARVELARPLFHTLDPVLATDPGRMRVQVRLGPVVLDLHYSEASDLYHRLGDAMALLRSVKDGPTGPTSNESRGGEAYSKTRRTDQVQQAEAGSAKPQADAVRQEGPPAAQADESGQPPPLIASAALSR